MHGYSGAYDVVAAHVAGYVRSLETRRAKPLYGQWSPEPPAPSDPVPASPATVARLIRRGYLTDMDEDEEEALFCDLVEHLHATEMTQRPAFLFMTTYDCNLRCGYCFQDHMRTDPAFAHLLRVMHRPMVDRIFAASPEIESGHGIEDLAATGQNITFSAGSRSSRGRGR